MFSKSVLALAAIVPFTLGQISDDFENGWDKTKWPIYAPDCNQGGSIVLDSTVAHSGKNSLKVTGGSSGYCGHIFFGTTAIPAGGDVFVRVWQRHAVALGDNHVTFHALPDSGLGSGKHLRLSGQMEIYEYNRESDDATLPSLSPQGIASSTGFPTNTWQCVEYELKNDGTINTWVDSKLISGLTVGPGVSNPNAGGWGTAYKPNVQGAYFGWESYAGSVDTVWYDDVAIAASRIGCSASGSSSSSPSSSSAAAPSSSAQASTTAAPTSSAKPSTTLVTSTAAPSQQCEIVYV